MVQTAGQEIITFRGYCELSSRKVFLVANSSAVGWTFPVTSVTRDTSVCSPGVAPFQAYVNSFQEYLLFVPGSITAGCHWTVVHANLDRLQWRPIVQHDTKHFVPAAVAGDACDERLQLHVGDRSLLPLHLTADHFTFQRAVPAGLDTFRDKDLPERGYWRAI